MESNWKFQRGDIYFVKLEAGVGSEQNGARPAVILQNDVGNIYSPTLIVAALTSKTDKKVTQATHCQVEEDGLKPSIVQAEQIFTIDKSRVLKFVGHLSPENMRRVDDAVKISLALNPMGSIQKLKPIIRSQAAYAPPEVVDARSELMPDLQIVPQEQFENAQRIRNERSVRSTAEAENRLPLNIHGKSLLAGNAYCGHCGAKLELTSSRKWRKMADGSLDDTLRIRYTCYGKLRKQTNCTGQTGYTVHILDEIIDKAVRQIFSKMRGIPKEQIVTKRYEKENAERKNHLQDLQTQRNKAEKDLLALKTEVLACIKGESVLPRETLAEMITAQEEKLTELENLCEAASEELEKTAELMDKVSRLYDELISYADLYDSANFEAKKMIVNQLIRRVDVYRGYQINISFNFDLTPYIEGE